MGFKKIIQFFSKKTPVLSAQPVVQASDGLQEVCVFPLPDVVLLPGTLLPLHIFEDRYKQMTEDVLKSDLLLAMSPQKDWKVGDAISIFGAGKLKLLQSYPDGRKDVCLEGRQRVEVKQVLQTTPYIKVLTKPIPDIPFASELEETRLHSELSRLVKRWVFLSPDLSDRYLSYVDCFTKSHELADFVANYFLPQMSEKQRLLETPDQRQRVMFMRDYLAERIHKLESVEGLNSRTDGSQVYH